MRLSGPTPALGANWGKLPAHAGTACDAGMHPRFMQNAITCLCSFCITHLRVLHALMHYYLMHIGIIYFMHIYII